MKSMVRRVQDDFQALLMCDAMTECGVEPFSVVRDPSGRWYVFARVDRPPQDFAATCDRVDAAYDRNTEGDEK